MKSAGLPSEIFAGWLAVDTHELLGTFQTQQQEVKAVVFSPDGGTLASVEHDDSIIFWTVEPDGWIKEACRVANRNLTQQEWNTYRKPAL